MSRLLRQTLWVVLVWAGISRNGFAQSRQVIPLNDNWEYYFAKDTRRNAPKIPVTLPHTWNADQVMKDSLHYYRGTAHYTRKLSVPEAWQGKRLFLRFEGVNSVATVLVNQQTIGRHKGGYTAFCLEITDAVKYGQDNLLTVNATNAYNEEVLPLSGDFNVYGGIHRPVALLVTEANCITPLDFASPGVYIEQTRVTDQIAEASVRTKLSLKKPAAALSLQITLRDHTGKVLQQKSAPVTATTETEMAQTFSLNKPRLWNGKADPYLYQVRVELLENGKTVDEINQPLGFRYYHVDPDQGFFLNGKYLDLHGVCRHQDVQGKGSALTREDHETDINLIKEVGATALRLTHYPHSADFYDLCDKNGLILWTEIPLVGPGGYTGPGYLKIPALHEHGKQVMTELIRQNYNHPSICFWGLYNELKVDFDSPTPYLKELQALAKQEDPTRPTTCATFLDDEGLSGVSDVVAWNKYFGWYGGKPEEMGTWADQTHRKFPKRPIAVSEYGAGASVKQHAEELKAPNPSGYWHPEEWQAYYHEGNWQALRQRPFVWGKFIWVMADFGSSIRSEGDTAGINDKGLVTYDRKTKKDAFYFYKANWNPEPMLYLAERRNVHRKNAVATVKVYTNLKEAELWVNGKSLGKQSPSDIKMIQWKEMALQKGENLIEVRGKNGKNILKDSCTWVLQ